MMIGPRAFSASGRIDVGNLKQLFSSKYYIIMIFDVGIDIIVIILIICR